MIDLSSNRRLISPQLNAIIAKALEDRQRQETPRTYLGGSRIGVECERQLQYDYFKAPKDPGRDFPGRILRIFQRGHWIEEAVIEWLRLAGVVIATHDDSGRQFGFSEHNGQYKGHCDGILISGPECFGPFPRLWENKGLKQSKFLALEKHKLRKENIVYWAQTQVYMEKFGLTENPALFSAVNMDNMSIYWESIEYNPTASSQYNAKAKRILQACNAGELLPRMSQDPNFYLCKFCDWNKRCFNPAFF
jgi:hypothetical protein